MATVQEVQEIQPISTGSATSSPARANLRVDIRRIRKHAQVLLRQGLGKYQRMLSSNLLTELDTEFSRWLSMMHDGIVAQLKTIPKRAREKWLEERLYRNDRRSPENQSIRLLIDFLFQYSQRQISGLKRLKLQNLGFRKTIANARTDRERQQAILGYAEQLGASTQQLRGDEKAFQRWFDEEAVNDRYEKCVGQQELLLALVFDRLGELLETVVRQFQSMAEEDGSRDEECLAEQFDGLWRRLSIEARLHEALSYDGDPRIYAAALRCLRRAVRQFPGGLAENLLDQHTLLTLHQVAAEGKADVWVQCEALSIVHSLSPAEAMPLLQRRIVRRLGADDMFVRRHIFKILEEHLLQGLNADVKLPTVAEEPSEFVRQQIAKVAFLSSDAFAQQLFRDFVLTDEVPQVRAAALLAGIDVDCSVTKTIEYLEVVTQSLQREQNSFVLRTACHVVTSLLQRLDDPGQATKVAAESKDALEIKAAAAKKRTTVHAFYQQRIGPVMRHLQCNHQDTAVRRWMAQACEQAWARIDEQAADLIRWLKPILPTIKPGTTRRLSKRRFAGIADHKLGRILAVLAQADFGLDVQRGYFYVHVQRGPTFGFRLWRLLHEMRNPATDKRQALSHTVGRINASVMRAPSQILGELSETKIPGEPLTVGEEGSWRPYLPLLDDFISTLNMSWLRRRSTTLYTSQGMTEIAAPRSIIKRVFAAYTLNVKFQNLADKRNWDGGSFPATTYIQSMRKLGFIVTFRQYDQPPLDLPPAPLATAANTDAESRESQSAMSLQRDQTVWQFFATACLAPCCLLGSLVESVQEQFLRYADYFGSSFENSIEELLVFTAVILFLILAKHFYSNFTLRRARRKIPLCIGGWGTRGKSGTERLKAALIGAMGHGLVSKTTGCEAMFIHGNPFGEPLEIPLFRPYDKATIWEQRNLIIMASKLQPSVFMWECMALTPSYVDVLQRQWTRDDLSTITNTYPDHEDLQGPAGHNVATTISGFVPVKSHLITSEEVMRPYVSDSCRSVGTTLRGVGWLESGLVTEDVLERFPYKEHPDNVALVAAMGDELGVEYEAAVKAMGDYLVPDLGVLKTHPVAEVRTRRIEFTNGMSANERFGCMGNWKRLGFDTQDPWEDPTTWVCGVVNNRADRVPRSKVFAKIIVEDIHADRFFLIGNNLKGLIGFIHEAWAENAQAISLCASGQPWERDFALATLKQAAWKSRQPTAVDHVQVKLRRMLEAAAAALSATKLLDVDAVARSWNDPDAVRNALDAADVSTGLITAVIKHQSELLTALGEYEDLLKLVQSATPKEAENVDSRYRQLMKTWYFRKLVTVENYAATGEEVVACIVDETPPGFFARTIGLQNIKGTGLDFVYRFQAWDVCHEACNAAEHDDPNVALRGLQALVAMPAIGQLATKRVREVIQAGRTSATMRRSDLQTLLSQLESNLCQESDDLPSAVPVDSIAAPAAAERKAAAHPGTLLEWNRWLVDTSEQLLDVNDSVRRRDRADAIYRDLTTGRIGRQRAVAELRKINKRQKGGWLYSWIAEK